jgi:putative chitinase
LEGVRVSADLSTAVRVRHFLAQLGHESGGFRSLVESTRYSDPARLYALFPKWISDVEDASRLIKAGPVAIGNRIYGSRMGNRGEASGDGYRFRGRGFIMLTGRDNYTATAKGSGIPLVDQPELLGHTDKAAQASAWFWTSRRINAAADNDDIDAVTVLVNGPKKIGLASRRAWLAATEAIWPNA